MDTYNLGLSLLMITCINLLLHFPVIHGSDDPQNIPLNIDIDRFQEEITKVKLNTKGTPTAQDLDDIIKRLQQESLNTKGHEVMRGHEKSNDHGTSTESRDIKNEKYESLTRKKGGKEDTKSSFLAEANSRFSLLLYKAFASNTDQNNNFIFSPLSLSSALLKLSSVTSKETAAQIWKTLHLDKLESFDIDDVEEILNEFGTILESVRSSDDENKACIDNQIFYDSNTEISNNLADLFTTKNSVESTRVDFQNVVETEQQINDWLSEVTGDIEQETVPLPNDASNSHAILVDITCLNPYWDKTFTKSKTKNAKFMKQNGDEIFIPTMHQRNAFYYGFIEEFKVPFIVLPTVKRQFSLFIFVLSAESEAAHFEDNLKPSHLENPLQTFRVLSIELQTQLALPRIQLRHSYSIRDTLKKLGITHAFTQPEPEVVASHDLLLDDVIHTVMLQLDESGTSKPAKALDALNMAQKQQKDIEFLVNRPFIFMLKETVSNMIVMMGKINNPSLSINLQQQSDDDATRDEL